MFRIPTIRPALPQSPAGTSSGATAHANDDPAPRVRHRTCRIEGRLVTYALVDAAGAAGAGAPTVLLLHGWGLSHSPYVKGAQAIARSGYRVILPDLPGFGSSTDLPFSDVSYSAFARVLRALVLADSVTRAIPTGDPPSSAQRVHVVGHSFGGAVAIQFAHDHAELTESLVLVSSVSGVTWDRADEVERLLSQRPLWDWGLNLLHEFPVSGFLGPAGTVVRDARHNLFVHLPTLALVAGLIRRSDLRVELGEVAGSGIPVSVVWAEGDRVVTRASYDDLCAVLGTDGTVVAGNHGWPIADPASFGKVIADLLPHTRVPVP